MSTRDTDKDAKPNGEDRSTESGSSSADVKVPFSPHKDDDSALGDTDQHSTA